MSDDINASEPEAEVVENKVEQEESLFEAPPVAEQERMCEAILFASAEPVTVKEMILMSFSDNRLTTASTPSNFGCQLSSITLMLCSLSVWASCSNT